MLEVPLAPELERMLAGVAARTGDAPGDLARAAPLKYPEDLEDYAVAVEAWRANDLAKNISSEELLHELGLEG